MCDYSAEATDTRKAAEGDKLVVEPISAHGTIGLVSVDDEGQAPTAVCLLPGTLISVSGIPKDLQKAWGVGETAKAVFDQRIVEGAAPGTYHRDGVIFKGKNDHVSLQAFVFDMRVDVDLVPSSGKTAARASRELVDA